MHRGEAGFQCRKVPPVVGELGGCGPRESPGRVDQTSTDADLDVWGKGSTQKRWCLSTGYMGRLLHRENGNCFTSPCPEATTESLSVYIWHLPSHRPSAGAQSESLPGSESVHESMKGHLVFLQPTVSPRCLESPLFFIARCCGGSSSRHCTLGWVT